MFLYSFISQAWISGHYSLVLPRSIFTMSSRMKRLYSYHPPLLQWLSAQNTISLQRLSSHSSWVWKVLTRQQGRGIFVGPYLGPDWDQCESGIFFHSPSPPRHPPTSYSLSLEGLDDLKYLPGSVVKMLINITRDLSLRCENLWYQQGVFKHNWQQEAYGQRFKLLLFFFIVVCQGQYIFFPSSK